MTNIVPKWAEIDILSNKLEVLFLELNNKISILEGNIILYSKNLKYTFLTKKTKIDCTFFLYQPNFKWVFTILANLLAKNLSRDIYFCDLFLGLLWTIGLPKKNFYIYYSYKKKK